MMSVERSLIGVLVATALVSVSPGTSASQGADAKVWENYDFIPGSKVLFFTDFSEDVVGNFARGLTHVSGPVEVVERDGVKVLRSTGASVFLIPVGRVLPGRFTLEIDVVAGRSGSPDYDIVAIEGGPELGRGDASAEGDWAPHVT